MERKYKILVSILVLTSLLLSAISLGVELSKVGPKGDKGLKGEQGIQGDKGDKGNKGDKGDKGDTGDKGEQGIQGEIGPRGKRGKAGVSGSDGISGQDGTSGQDGVNGTVGLKGDKGDKGDTGESGPVNQQPVVTLVSIDYTGKSCHKETTLNVLIEDNESDLMHIEFYYNEDSIALYFGGNGTYSVTISGHAYGDWLVETIDGSGVGLNYF